MATASVLQTLLFIESIPLTPLNETFTRDVYRSAIEHYEDILWVLAPPPQKMGPKNYPFWTTSQLSGNFEG